MSEQAKKRRKVNLLTLPDEALVMFGRLHDKMQDTEEAKKYWKALLKAWPESPFASEAKRRLASYVKPAITENTKPETVRISGEELKSLVENIVRNALKEQ